MEKTKQRYWICAIGPTDQNKIPSGSDAPMRMAVENAFKKVTKHDSQELFSGWGNDEERLRMVNYAWNIDKDNPFYKKLLKMIDHDNKVYEELTQNNLNAVDSV